MAAVGPLWKDYRFSQISKLECKETRYDDLSTPFEALMG